MNVRLRMIMLCGAASIVAGPTWAQSAVGDDAANGPQLEELVVTAQKRSETLQKVPITVAVVTEREVAAAGATSTLDLARLVPGFVANKNLGNGIVYLRGVGQSTAITGGAESPVATYIDGVYVSTPAAGVFNLNNIEQISVLKGPQGTLFGRNTTGGVVQVVTRDPGREFGGRAEVGYASYNTLSGRLYVNKPLTDELSTNFAIAGKNRATGYVRNVYTGNRVLEETSYTLQNKWRWTPTERTDVVLDLIYDRYSGGEGANLQIAPGALAPDQVTTFLGSRKVSARVDGTSTSRFSIGALKVRQDLDWAILSGNVAISAFHQNLLFAQTSTSGLPNPGNFPATILRTPAAIDTRSAEIQLQAPSGQDFQWIVGGFYLDDNNDYSLINYQDEVFAASINAIIHTKSYAAYTQATKTVFEGTRLTAGLRYTHDEKRIGGITDKGVGPAQTLPPQKSWQRVTWRLSLDHDFGDNVLGYVSYNRGFKAGLYNATSFANPPVNPEVVDAYEIGVKSQLMDNRLRLNLTGFHYDYNDIQLRTSVAVPVIGIFTYNAAKAKIDGFDVDVAALVTDNLRLNVSAEYLDAKYTDFPTGQFAAPNPLRSIPSNCQPKPLNNKIGGVTTLTCDLSGYRLQRAPKFVANISGEYGWDTRFGRMTLNASDNYNSGFFFDSDNQLKQKAYHQVSASLSLTAPDEAWNVKVWGTNLANAVVFGSGGVSSSFYTLPAAPPMYGVTFGTKF
ncbi:TonB-dependent receptor [Phenylobacterium sp.]|uniref:TonB-dependent receptor n=1 Tax=Phenylobacterium sp. TaxID=1871053 RepID=UPI0035AEA638